MKILKWILGILVGIGGMLAMGFGSSKRAKQLKKDIKKNKKDRDRVKKLIEHQEGKRKTTKKKIKKNKKEVEDLKSKKKNIKPKKKTAKKAHSRLKNIGKGKK
tara:strand:- start:547 stop:855 length:309 start_codon:yes stop_codon:yes gene_type:complete